MKGIIWYEHRSAGIARFEQLLHEYDMAHIACTKCRNTSFEVSATFENGDTWRLAPASDHSRGQACNIGLIERSVPEDIVHEVIFPCIKGYPYRAYNYYS